MASASDGEFSQSFIERHVIANGWPGRAALALAFGARGFRVRGATYAATFRCCPIGEFSRTRWKWAPQSNAGKKNLYFFLGSAATILCVENSRYIVEDIVPLARNSEAAIVIRGWERSVFLKTTRSRRLTPSRVDLSVGHLCRGGRYARLVLCKHASRAARVSQKRYFFWLFLSPKCFSWILVRTHRHRGSTRQVTLTGCLGNASCARAAVQQRVNCEVWSRIVVPKVDPQVCYSCKPASALKWSAGTFR